MFGKRNQPAVSASAAQQSRSTADLVAGLEHASSASDVSRVMAGMTQDERRRAADGLEVLNATKALVTDLEYRGL